MMIELTEIESKYFDLMEDKISIKEFEDWVYQSNWLEKKLNKDEYLDLISLNFNTPSVKYEVRKILESRVNEGKFQNIIFLNLLNSIIERDGKEGESLARMYDLYCDGYYFLMDLGLGIGLEITTATSFSAHYFHELNESQKERLVNSVYPIAKELAEELKNWIVNEQLILTGETDSDLHRWEFIDNRSEKDKQSRVWEVVDRDKETNDIRAEKNVLLDENGDFVDELKSKQKWWQKLIK